MIKRIIDILLRNETLLIALASGIGVTIFRQLSNTFDLIRDFIEEKLYFKVTINEDSPLFKAVNEWYVGNNSEKVRNSFVRFDVKHVSGKPVYKLSFIPMGTLQLINFNGGKMLLKKTTDYYKSDDAYVYEHEYTITGFAENSVRGFLQYLEDGWNGRDNPGLRIIVSSSTGYDTEKNIHKVIYKTFDDIFFKEKQQLIDHLDLYLASEALYRKKKIAYKTSILLGGVPGNGKTCTGFAIADYTRRPIYYINPGGFVNDEAFQDYVIGVEPGSVILMEDVDSFFGSREEGRGSKTSLSFSSVLNTLDGLFSPHDVIFIMTTNKPEELDRAMIRKGRLDLKIFFDNPRGIEINAYISKYFDIVLENGLPGEFCSPVPMVDVEAICKESVDAEQALTKIKQL